MIHSALATVPVTVITDSFRAILAPHPAELHTEEEHAATAEEFFGRCLKTFVSLCYVKVHVVLAEHNGIVLEPECFGARPSGTLAVSRIKEGVCGVLV